MSLVISLRKSVVGLCAVALLAMNAFAQDDPAQIGQFRGDPEQRVKKLGAITSSFAGNVKDAKSKAKAKTATTPGAKTRMPESRRGKSSLTSAEVSVESRAYAFFMGAQFQRSLYAVSFENSAGAIALLKDLQTAWADTPIADEVKETIAQVNAKDFSGAATRLKETMGTLASAYTAADAGMGFNFGTGATVESIAVLGSFLAEPSLKEEVSKIVTDLQKTLKDSVVTPPSTVGADLVTALRNLSSAKLEEKALTDSANSVRQAYAKLIK